MLFAERVCHALFERQRVATSTGLLEDVAPDGFEVRLELLDQLARRWPTRPRGVRNSSP
jgi:hypothetical protein